MKWNARAVPSRANISFFLFVIFFAVFGVIVLIELLLLEQPNMPRLLRSRYNENLQNWERRTETGGNENGEIPGPPHAPLDGVWQPVDKTRFKFYVYSAYVESRTVAAIRIIAATKTRGPDSVMCRLWMPNNITVTLKAYVRSIRENWNLKYSATYVLCLLGKTGIKPRETVGASISVIASNAVNLPPTNLLTILDTTPRIGIETELHVCVKPFHANYARNGWLMEWFEFNRLLGATHFYMYNHTMSPTVSCVVEHYRNKGLVTLLPWHLPISSKVEIRTEGQFAAFNDCLYRSMSAAAWLVVIDIDELILPRRERTLLALLTSLISTYTPASKAPSALLFRNAFFYVGWEDDDEGMKSLLTSRKTRRWVKPHGLKNRSKLVVRPTEIIELGNHFVWEHARGATSAGVPTDRALLHHYRLNCEYDGTGCLSVPSRIDRTALRWSDELSKQLKSEEKTASCAA